MADPAQLGDVVGGYVLESVLGRGGMGTVFLGRHQLLGRKAAVKVLAAELARHDELVSRFFHEAKVVNDVRHPNIVDVIDFVQTQQPLRVAFIMEYLEGAPLDKRLKRDGPLELHAALNVFLQVAGGLRAVHEIGVVHRDLKPANLRFVREDVGDCSEVPVIKVLDFGIAKASGPVVGHKTQTGVVMGTPAYMAPEQVSGDKVSSASDVYALGEILYELVSGRRLFKGTNAQMLRAKLLEPPVVEMPEAGRDAPLLEALVRDCLSLEPDRRPSTAELIARASALREGLDTSPVPVGFDEEKPTAQVSSAREAAFDSLPVNTLPSDSVFQTPAPPSSRRWIWPILGVAMLGLAALVGTRIYPFEGPVVARAVDPVPEEPAEPARTGSPAAEERPKTRAEAPPETPVEAAPETSVEAPPKAPVAEGAAPKPEKVRPKKRRRSRRRPPRRSKPVARPTPAPPEKEAPKLKAEPEVKAAVEAPKKVETGKLKITAWTTAGRKVPATIRIDGKRVRGSAPVEFTARAGRRRIVVEAVGHPPKTEMVKVRPNETTAVDVVVDLK